MTPRITFSVQMDGVEDLLWRIAAAAGAPSKTRHESVADILREDARMQFMEGGRPPWRPLSPHTVAKKIRDGYPRLNRRGQAPVRLHQRGVFAPLNVLMRTGALLSSWTVRTDPDHVETIEIGRVSIGSRLAYAATHQYGRMRGGWHGSEIPARPIRITDRALTKIRELLGGN